MFLSTIFGYDYAHFHDVLLVINYNWPHYQTIDFIKSLYGDYFPNMVFYGPIGSNEVIQCSHNHGAYSYLAIVDAMERYPHFSGYLYVHDDCLILP